MSEQQDNDSGNWLMIGTTSTQTPKVDEQHAGTDCNYTLDFSQKKIHHSFHRKPFLLMRVQTLCYTNCVGLFRGLATRPCHGLVDTGAQDGLVGLWHVQRWCTCLASIFGLRLLFEALATDCKAGGIRGSAAPIGLAEMPL